jgi:hypothetical protein
MSDSELDISSFNNTDTSFINLPTRSQRSQRLNYHVLNDGSDEEAISEDRIFKKPRLTSQSTIDSFVSNELIRPENSASQLLPNPFTITESSLELEFSINSSSDISLLSKSPTSSRIKPHNR